MAGKKRALKSSPESEKTKDKVGLDSKDKEIEENLPKKIGLDSKDQEIEENPSKKRALNSTPQSEKTKRDEIAENPQKRTLKSSAKSKKTKQDEEIEENPPKKLALKSATKSTKNEKNKPDKENEEIPQRRSTRSTRSTRSMAEDGGQADEEVEKKKLTFVNYRGAIKYYTETNEIAETSENLLQWVEKQPGEGLIPIAFDMEWPFSFKTGPGKSAVIQICAELTTCYVFQLTNVKKIPAALASLLKHKRVRLHGVNVKNDFRKLGRDYPEVNSDELIVNGLDLGVWCNQICETGGRWSLDRLAGYAIEKAVDKNKKVRMSKWDVIPLNENQLLYAALDVYIGKFIYFELEKRLKIKEENESSFIEKNGEAAFKAVKALGENFVNEKATEAAA